MTQPMRLQLVITADGKQAAAEIHRVRQTIDSLGAGVAVADPFEPAAKGGKKAADATKLAAHEATNLSYQLNDMAMMLASGQSPFMVMMQQGSQVSQIMGARGLGSLLPALTGGLASMVNPTMLALAAITALGYGAGAVFSSLRGDVKTADEALAEHEAAIKALKEAWGEAGKGVDDYVARTRRSVLFDLVQSATDTRAQLNAEAQHALNLISSANSAATTGNLSGGFGVPLGEKFAPFKAAIEDLRLSIAAGTPDIVRFRDEVEKIALAEPSNRLLQDLAKELRDTTNVAYELARALPAAEAAIDGSAAAAARAAGLIEAYGDALDRLSKAQSADEAVDAAKAASHHAQTLGEALKAAEDLDRKLLEIGGRGTPLPSLATGTTPNREDVLAEDAARRERQTRELAREAEHYDRLAGSIAAATAKAELEMALIGASLAERNRATAAIEAETIIRQLGIETMGAEAEALRRQGRELADLRTAVEKAADAWGAVKSAGESAIDGMVDRLASGDLKGAIEGLTRDITKMTLQLGLANPLKNVLFGGDNPTYGDLKQGGGLIGKLFGGGGQAPIDAAVGRVAATMHVTAATVIVNGGIGGGVSGGLGSVLGGLGGGASAANDNSVAGQVWNFFASKGLAAHQVAGISGNIGGESGFNPFAVGDGGTSFGLAQQHAGRAKALLDFIGGKNNLGDVGKQLDFIWKELQGPENGALKRLLASSNVREATAAFAGYERPRGWSLDNPEASDNFLGRLRGAEQALDKFAGQAGPAAKAVSQLDDSALTTASTLTGSASSLDAAGKAMKAAATAFPQAPAATGGSWFKKLSSSVLAAIGGYGPAKGLYDKGGFTGPGDPKDVAGVVHRSEYVFDAVSTRRIGPENLEALRRGALRGYESGGYVGASLAATAGAPSATGPGGGGTVVQLIDNAGVSKRTEQGRGPNGEALTRIILEKVGGQIASGGYDGAMSRYGARPRKVVR